jgi:hypothetical protein
MHDGTPTADRRKRTAPARIDDARAGMAMTPARAPTLPGACARNCGRIARVRLRHP